MNAPFTPPAELAYVREAAAALLEFADKLERAGKWTRSVAEAEVAAMRALEAIWPDTLTDVIECRVDEFDLEPRDANGCPLDPSTARCWYLPDGSREWKGDRL